MYVFYPSIPINGATAPGIGSAKEIAEFVWALSTDGYDCTIDFQGLLKSAFFAYLSGAPVRIGWERDFLKESVSRFFYTEVVTPKRIHIIDQQMELLTPLGIEPNWETEVAAARPSCGAPVAGEKASGPLGLRPDQSRWQLADQMLGS